jgi:esterase/lipase superfamily enzyme
LFGVFSEYFSTQQPIAMRTLRLFLFALSALFLLPFCKGPAGAALSEVIQVEKDSLFDEIYVQRRSEANILVPKGFMGEEPKLDPTLYSTVPVYFATDRKPSGKEAPNRYYSGKAGELQFGKCMVTIPSIHELGELERPRWWKVEFSENAAKHMVLESITPLDEAAFFDSLHWVKLTASRPEALVFIHGFNVSFDEAALRAAQIAYDVSFGGIPVLYSWSSKGSPLKYRRDGKQNGATIPKLEYFLEALATQGNFEQIHIVAHSMGNQALTQTLMEFAKEDPEEPLFGQVILAAPDVDAAAFTRDIAPRILGTAQNITLYASKKDKALLLSQKINKGPRAGLAGENLVVVNPIQTIDASDIDTDFLGHSYFSNTWLLINDLHYLINKGLPAQERLLKEGEKEGQPYWLF